MIVVANASPICYLLLIGCLDVLPILFGQVILPQAVRDELEAEGAPALVRDWITQLMGLNFSTVILAFFTAVNTSLAVHACRKTTGIAIIL